MKKVLFFICLLPCMQISAQFRMPPYTVSDMGYKGPVKTVTTYYEDIINGMPYTKVEHFNQKGFLESYSVKGEMRYEEVVFHFDKSGRLTGATEYTFDSIVTTLIYDKKGCIVGETNIHYLVDEGEIEYDTMSYENGPDCKPRLIRYKGGALSTLTYDKNGRLVSRKSDDWIVEYTYDKAGHLTCENSGHGEFVDYYVYDNRGLLVQHREVRDGEETDIRKYTYLEPFDKYGNWLKCSTTYPAYEEEGEELILRTIEYYSK